MGSLAEILISFLNLLEAEGKALRVGVVKAGLALALAALVFALFGAAMGLIIWAIYLYLRINNGAPTSALLTGLITLLIAGIVTWVARLTAR